MSKALVFACLVGLVLAMPSSLAYANIAMTDTTNSTLANSQVEVGSDTSENPDVTGGLAGTLVPYAESSTNGFFDAPFDGSNLDDGDVGAGNLSDGTYAILGDTLDSTLSLDFGGMQTIASIAIYMGYDNRDDATFTLKDAGGATIGAWIITDGNDSCCSNEDVDSFWITFNTPVSTTALDIDITSVVDTQLAFREIQVFDDMIAPPLTPGDVDGNDIVDLVDFEIIRSNFFGVNVGRANGDLDLSGFVDLDDFGEWKDNFTGASPAQSLAGAVPEPGSAMLLVIGVVLAGVVRTRRAA